MIRSDICFCIDNGKFKGKKSEIDIGQSDVEAKNSGRALCREDVVISAKSERELGRNEVGLSVGGKLLGLFI